MSSQYDIMVIGGGPAGLSAVASIVRQHHKTVIFDSGKYRNEKSKYLHTLSGWDHKEPAELRTASRNDFTRYGSVTIEDVEVEDIKKRDDGLFEVSSNGKIWVGKKVILATGVEDIFPDIPGYADCWVSGMSVGLQSEKHEYQLTLAVDPTASTVTAGKNGVFLQRVF